HHLADVLLERESLDEARSLASEAVSIYSRHPDWPAHEREHALQVLAHVAEAFSRQQQSEQAEQVWRELLEFVRNWTAATGRHEPLFGWLLHHAADFLVQQHKADEAYVLAEEALALYRSHDDWSASERSHAERVRQAALNNMANA